MIPVMVDRDKVHAVVRYEASRKLVIELAKRWHELFAPRGDGQTPKILDSGTILPSRSAAGSPNILERKVAGDIASVMDVYLESDDVHKRLFAWLKNELESQADTMAAEAVQTMLGPWPEPETDRPATEATTG